MKKFTKYHLPFSNNSGFTLVEVTLVASIFFILVGLATVNLFNFQHQSQLDSSVKSFLADYKEQQIKAMAGDTESSGAIANYGVHIEPSSYTLFRDSYGTNNFVVSLPGSTTMTTTFPNSQVIFTKGSGEVSGFVNGQNTITLHDSGGSGQKEITINRFGTVIAVN